MKQIITEMLKWTQLTLVSETSALFYIAKAPLAGGKVRERRRPSAGFRVHRGARVHVRHGT